MKSLLVALLISASPSVFADCVQNLYRGRVECGPGKCSYNRYKAEVKCAITPNGGSAYDEYHAVIQCGTGQCEYDFYHAEIKCSNTPGGYASYDPYHAVISCSNGCESGSESKCQPGQPL